LELLGKRKISEESSQHKVARTTDLEFDFEPEPEHLTGPKEESEKKVEFNLKDAISHEAEDSSL
ncbi:hypothetical protein JRQ81_000068, partial [Phrynocephalus forsythii]